MLTKRITVRRSALEPYPEKTDKPSPDLSHLEFSPDTKERLDAENRLTEEEQFRKVGDESRVVDEPGEDDSYWLQDEYRMAVEAETKIIDEALDGLRCELSFSLTPNECKHLLHRISELREGRQQLIDDYMARYPGRNPFPASKSICPPQPEAAPTKPSENPQPESGICIDSESGGRHVQSGTRMGSVPLKKARANRSIIFLANAVLGRLDLRCRIFKRP